MANILNLKQNSSLLLCAPGRLCWTWSSSKTTFSQMVGAPLETTSFGSWFITKINSILIKTGWFAFYTQNLVSTYTLALLKVQNRTFAKLLIILLHLAPLRYNIISDLQLNQTILDHWMVLKAQVIHHIALMTKHNSERRCRTMNIHRQFVTLSALVLQNNATKWISNGSCSEDLIIIA